VSRAAVPKFVTAYTNQAKKSSAERKSGRQRKLSERDCHILKRIVTKNHRTTAAKVTAQLNIHPEDIVKKNSPTRASQIEHPRQSCNY